MTQTSNLDEKTTTGHTNLFDQQLWLQEKSQQDTKGFDDDVQQEAERMVYEEKG